EDGIRDFHVTGVQTCALPIYRIVQLPNTLYFYRQRNSKTSITGSKPTNLKGFILCLGKIEGEFTYSPEQSFLFRRFAYKVLFFRSEERRVGKECTSRLSTHDY